jgi:Ca-activated chloride channel family protein
LKKPPTLLLRKGLIVIRCLAVSLIIMALARPQSGIKSTEIITEGVDIMLCLDTSGSMQALDFKDAGKRADRLHVVKKVVSDFIRGRKNDRIGMVVFGEEAFTQCPLTLDYGVLLSFLDSVKIGMAGDSTAIGSALAVCVKRLKDLQSKSKVIVLLTDGRNNTGTISPGTAADIAKAYGIKTYTIGVGTEGEAPFLVDSFFGKQYVYQKVDLDEDTLKKIAKKTGGIYFRATNTEALKNIYKQIDEMEKTEVKIKEYMEYEELFMYFLIPGLCLVLLEAVSANTRLRKIP